MASVSLSPTALPANADLRHLRDEARDLVKTGQAPSRAKALFLVARRYGFASWPKLKADIESRQEAGQLKSAIDAEDWPLVREMMTRNSTLHRAPIGYNNNGPLTWLAECRIPRRAPTSERLVMAEWMLQNGSDVHQGGDGPLMRAALDDERIPMMDLLVSQGADVNALWDGFYPIVLAPCETLQAKSLRWLLEHGADPARGNPEYATPIGMLLGTYSRRATAKHACLAIFAERGFAFPDTPTMALHRGRLDVLETHLERYPALLSQQFTRAEIYPSELGLKTDDGLTSTPIDGATLLHLATEWDDLAAIKWLLAHGANPNARTPLDDQGWGGQTPLFHALVTMGDRSETKARLLLNYGADPDVRASLTKKLDWLGPDARSEFSDVTAAEYAGLYPEPNWVSAPGLALITTPQIDKGDESRGRSSAPVMLQ